MTRQGSEEIVPNLTQDNFIHICASFLEGIQERQLTSIAVTGRGHLSTEDENLLHLILYMPHPDPLFEAYAWTVAHKRATQATSTLCHRIVESMFGILWG
jgi:hypothetical protein